MARMINGELHDIWSKEDVKHQASDKGVEISDEQCVEVLENAARHHDATIGINWDVLDFWIGEVTSPSKSTVSIAI